MSTGYHHSAMREVAEASCTQDVRSAIRQLRHSFGADKIRLFHWGDEFTGVLITVTVHLPSRGTWADVDIREEEPLLLVFDNRRYPARAPRVFSDRDDFPSASLPHLIPTPPGMPACLCLHRGNIDEWFAEHTIVDLMRRAINWLQDAAAGRLIREDDRFEPTRLDTDRIVGTAVYDPDMLIAFVERQGVLAQGPGQALLPCLELVTPDGEQSAHNVFWVNSGQPVRFEDVETLPSLHFAKKGPSGYGEVTHGQVVATCGILAWPAAGRVCTEYFGHLPNNLRELGQFAERLGIELQAPFDACRVDQLVTGTDLLLVLAIRRPTLLIGSPWALDLINFVVQITPDNWPARDGWLDHDPVSFLTNAAPLTRKHARELSLLPELCPEPRTLLVGCGALGSKIALHLARAGMTRYRLIDHRQLGAHNMVRHGLLASRIGQNKAVALAEEIRDLFPHERGDVNVLAMPRDLLDVLSGDDRKVIADYDWTLDCTASPLVLNALTEPRRTGIPRAFRAEIADQGRLGFVLVEGEGRNPRLDDLQAHLYDRALDDSSISSWLHRQRLDTESEVGPALEEISVGLGCSSPTMRVSDDVVSYHAAVAAMVYRAVTTGRRSIAGIQISHWDSEIGVAQEVELIAVDGVHELMPPRADGWRVRIGTALCDDLQAKMAASGPNETGGLLLGFLHRKRKIIYVTRALDPPADSQGWPYAFRLGVARVPEQLDWACEQSNGLIRYVGEWHSHPAGSFSLSEQDRKAMQQLEKSLSRAQWPVHIMIVTPKGCYSHLAWPVTAEAGIA